jgi:glycosyltransferase involved in cell wall biosynthesis
MKVLKKETYDLPWLDLQASIVPLFYVYSLRTKMSNSTPKVSIGLAVYNGERYIEQTIQSILSQTFRDFELVISDNASTDQTGAICQKFSEQDSRIRYSRNESNIGGANNENLTFTLARGMYFRWAAHDDICAPQLLEKLVEVLENDPSIILVHSRIMKIDENGRPLGVLDQNKATADTPSARFCDLTGLDHDCEATYGLIRSEIMAQTGLERNYTDSDRSFLAHLSLFGKFHQVPEVLFYKRIHPDMSTKVFQDWRGRMAWFGANQKNQIVLPHWMQFFHYLEMITYSPIPLMDKLYCYKHMVGWIFLYRRWRSMIKDVLLAIQKFFRVRFQPRSALR